MNAENESAATREYPCEQCGAKLEYAPGQGALRCPYCGRETPVLFEAEAIEELDYRERLRSLRAAEAQIGQPLVRCPACAAEVTFDNHVDSDLCPYCGTGLVRETSESRALRPRALLPFAVPRARAVKLFRDWLKSLWFAPGDLKRFARTESRLSGVYVPYWTYDCRTDCAYTGQRGDDYWDIEHYTAHENGKAVRKTRRVRKTRWHAVSGTVGDNFDDILVLASRSLPRKYADKLTPWDLENLVPYAEECLSGFRTERYQVELDEGFDLAKGVMESAIRSHVRRDIGGDHQRIHSLRVRYDEVTFKHLLLPVWISTYRYRDKPYRFLVNARTGEVQGERPWSAWKIALAVLAGLIVLGGSVALVAALQ